MSSWLTRLSKKKEAKTGIAPGDASPVPIRESEQKSPSDSVRSIIERAVTDAEQIAGSIKTKARKEAEDEAAKIIGKARQEADEISRQAKTAGRKETEAKLAARAESKRKAEEARKAEETRKLALKQAEKEARLAAKKEVKEKAEESKEPKMPAGTLKVNLSWRPKINLGKKSEAKDKIDEAKKTGATQPPKWKPGWLPKINPGKKLEAKGKINEAEQTGAVQPPIEPKAKVSTGENPAEKKPEHPVQPENEVTLPKPAESTADRSPGKPPSEGEPGKQEPVTVAQDLNPDAGYTGEIELAVAVPADPAAVAKLYNYLRAMPDVKVLYAKGASNRGTIITVSLDKPLPLISMISKIPGLEIAPGLPQKEEPRKGTSGSLPGTKKKESTRIDLILKTK